jgi:hypothetical protein
MSDEVVQLAYSFNFDFLAGNEEEENPMQRLVISRDLSKLLEIFTDSRCRIYTHRQ